MGARWRSLFLSFSALTTDGHAFLVLPTVRSISGAPAVPNITASAWPELRYSPVVMMYLQTERNSPSDHDSHYNTRLLNQEA